MTKSSRLRGGRLAPGGQARGRGIRSRMRAGRRVLPHSERIRSNPARSAPDRRLRHDREIERLNALAEAQQQAENRALGLYASDTDEDGAEVPRTAFLDDLRSNQLLRVGSLVRPEGEVAPGSSSADRDSGAAHPVGRLLSTSGERAVSYHLQLCSERAAVQDAVGVSRGATTSSEVDYLLSLLRGQVDSAHLYDSVRLSTRASAQVLGLPSVGDREVQFIYELLLVSAVSDLGHTRA